MRVAQSKALPTDEEVSQSGYADAGEFLLRLQQEDKESYAAFVEARCPGRLKQPQAGRAAARTEHTPTRSVRMEWQADVQISIGERLRHLLLLIVRSVAGALSRLAHDHKLDQKRGRGRAQGRKKSYLAAADDLSWAGGRISAEALEALSMAFDEQSDAKATAATEIQKMWRGKTTRVGQEKRRVASVAIQRHARGKRPRTTFSAKRQAAVVIESSYRGDSDRQRTREMRAEAAAERERRRVEVAARRRTRVRGEDHWLGGGGGERGRGGGRGGRGGRSKVEEKSYNGR